MRKLIPVILCLIGLPAMALATEDCPDCILGLFDSPDITHAANFGTMSAGVPKDLYLGVQLGPGETGLTGVEFSITGMRQVEDGILVLGVTPIVTETVKLGSVQAPVDTTAASAGVGGMNIAWPACLAGSRMLAQIQILSFAPLTNKVFQVKRRFPTSNATNFPLDAVLTRCDALFTSVRIKKLGCYTANGNGTAGCPNYNTPVQGTTWSAVKTLYSN